MSPNLSLRNRLVAFFVGVSVVLLTVAAIVAYSNGSIALTEAALSEMEGVAIDKETAISFWLQDAITELKLLGITPVVSDTLVELQQINPNTTESRSRLNPLLAYFNRYVGEGTHYISIMVLDPDSGQVVTSTESSEIGEYKTDQSYFENGRRGIYASPPYFSESLQSPAKTISTPVVDDDGNLLAVLVARLNLEELGQIILLDTGSRQTRDSYLVTLDGLLVTKPRYLVEAEFLGASLATESIEQCLRGEKGVLQSIDYREVEVISAYRVLSDEGLCLIVKMDQEEISQQVLGFGKDMVLPLSLTLAGALALSVVLARSFTNPLLELEEAASSLGHGLRDTRLTVRRKDELGRLAEQFNRMADSIADQFAELQKTKEDLEIYSAKLEANNRDLQEFAYVASHDLQEPLRKVLAFGDRLTEKFGDKLGETGNDYVSRMRGASQRMQSLLNDLLAYSRVSTRAQPFEKLDLHQTVSDVVSDLSERIELSGGKVVFNELPTIAADQSQMYQLMLNLIANALKFHKEGQAPIIEISYSINDDFSEIRVEDNGIGFDTQYTDRIFKPFERLHTREAYDGSGIGLAICRRIVERHNGTITAESMPGVGSSFIVTLPVHQSEGVPNDG